MAITPALQQLVQALHQESSLRLISTVAKAQPAMYAPMLLLIFPASLLIVAYPALVRLFRALGGA